MMTAKRDFCPKCGRTFPNEDVTWCEHCATKLVTEDTLEASQQLLEQDSVEIYMAENPIEAEMIRELLESNGILCALVGEVPSSVFPFTIDGLAKVRILVLEDVAKVANKIIQDTLKDAAKNEAASGEKDEAVSDENDAGKDEA